MQSSIDLIFKPAACNAVIALSRPLPGPLTRTSTSFTPNWSKWRGYAASAGGGMNGELDEVLNGRKSLQDAVDAFVEYGNSVLAGN